MKPVFSIFHQAIKFDRLFLAIFQSFYWFVSFIFDKLALPLNKCFKRYFKSFLVYSSAQDCLRIAKNVVFSLFCI